VPLIFWLLSVLRKLGMRRSISSKYDESAGVVGDWPVPLARPRDIAEIKLDPAFQKLHTEIWDTLKAEVLRGYAQADQS